MSETSRYLCLNLGAEEFAIPLLTVKEVLGMPEVTPIPQTPTYFLGIMNLRGQVISVVDLRTKLGIKPSNSEETAVIILDLDDSSFGIVVDKVNSVQEISKEQLSEKPSLENSKANEFINGVFKKENGLILVLDISRTLSVGDKATMSKTAKAA